MNERMRKRFGRFDNGKGSKLEYDEEGIENRLDIGIGDS